MWMNGGFYRLQRPFSYPIFFFPHNTRGFMEVLSASTPLFLPIFFFHTHTWFHGGFIGFNALFLPNNFFFPHTRGSGGLSAQKALFLPTIFPIFFHNCGFMEVFIGSNAVFLPNIPIFFLFYIKSGPYGGGSMLSVRPAAKGGRIPVIPISVPTELSVTPISVFAHTKACPTILRRLLYYQNTSTCFSMRQSRSIAAVAAERTHQRHENVSLCVTSLSQERTDLSASSWHLDLASRSHRHAGMIP